MKILYITDFENAPGVGIGNKILNQVKFFRNQGFHTEMTESKFYKRSFLSKVLNRLPFYSKTDFRSMYNEYKDFDGIYLRYFRSDWGLINFFKKLRKHNPDIKILVEIVTYPYDGEVRYNLRAIHSIIKDKVNRKKMHKYIDRIVTFSRDDEIFGAKTIKTINGIDVFGTAKRNIYTGNRISIIVVARIIYWHGIDLFIKGLAEYKKSGGTRDIIFHIVGDFGGDDEKDYRKIAAENQLENQVIFHGRLVGKELDDIYNKANLAMECLGLHRKKLTLCSTLKTREYAAKGLPVFGSNDVDIYDSTYPYYLRLPSGEVPADINKVIEFFDKVYPDSESYQRVHDYIRRFAEEKCDMSTTMKPIADYFKS